MTFTWRRGAAYLLIRYERTVREALRNPIQVLSSLTEKSKNESYRFQRLYRNLYNPEFYWLAYKNIYANTGSMTAGADGTTIDGMSDERIQRIIESMRDKSYLPKPARREYIAKKNSNKKRPLGIQSGNDKLVQEVVKMILESIYEPVFKKTSHGFRPNKSCQTALYQMTNATLINKNNVSFIVKNIDEINISIDGIDEKTTDRVRGKGVFKKVLDTVNLLHEEDFGNIALSMVFGDKNYHLESKFIALNRRLGTRPVIRGFAEMGRGKENKDVFSTKEKMKNVDIIFDENNLQQEFTKSLSPCTCGAGKEKILVDYKGDIYPCQWFREVEDKMGNALEKNVSELHLTKAVRRVESFYPWKYPKCHECCVNYFCWPCPGELKEKAIDEEQIKEICKKMKPILYKRIWNEVIEDEI